MDPETRFPRARLAALWLRPFRAAAFAVWMLTGTMSVAAVGILGAGSRRLACKRALSRLTYRGLLRCLGVRLRMEGHPAEGAVLCAANHVGYLDLAALGAGPVAGFVAKAELESWPLIGGLSKAVGTLFLRRGDVRAAQQSVAALRSRLERGQPWGIFPEGTSTAGEGILPFHAALFEAACAGSHPIQPVALRYEDAEGRPAGAWAGWHGESAFLPHLWQMLARPGWRLRVAYLEPFRAPHRKIAAEEARDAIAVQLAVWNRVGSDAETWVPRARKRLSAVSPWRIPVPTLENLSGPAA